MYFGDEAVEEMAEAAHEIFCEYLKQLGYKYGPKTSHRNKIHSSLRPYKDLPEDEKEQNRDNVQDIPRKLAGLGYKVVSTGSNNSPVSFSGNELEKLAELEHERWMNSKLQAGWTYAPATDKDKKLHQCLLPWSELSEDEKNEDRVMIGGIPEILAKAGYGVSTG